MLFRFIHINEDGELAGTNDEKLAHKIAQFEQIFDTQTGQVLRFWHENPSYRFVPVAEIRNPQDWLDA